jgi:hypothetical protein
MPTGQGRRSARSGRTTKNPPRQREAAGQDVKSPAARPLTPLRCGVRVEAQPAGYARRGIEKRPGHRAIRPRVEQGLEPRGANHRDESTLIVEHRCGNRHDVREHGAVDSRQPLPANLGRDCMGIKTGSSSAWPGSILPTPFLVNQLLRGAARKIGKENVTYGGGQHRQHRADAHVHRDAVAGDGTGEREPRLASGQYSRQDRRNLERIGGRWISS